jgi:hypothetical protein
VIEIVDFAGRGIARPKHIILRYLRALQSKRPSRITMLLPRGRYVLLALFTASAAAAKDAVSVHPRWAWPDEWGAHVTETVSIRDQPVVTKQFEVHFKINPGAGSMLIFHPVENEADEGPVNPAATELAKALETKDLKLGPDGSVVALCNERVERKETRDFLRRMAEQSGATADLIKMMTHESNIDRILAEYRRPYCHWMCGALLAPVSAGERRSRSGTEFMAGMTFPYTETAWFEKDPEGREDRILTTFVREATHTSGDADTLAMIKWAASIGVTLPPPSKPSAEFTLHSTTTSKALLDAKTLTPISVEVTEVTETSGVASDSTSNQRISYRYEFGPTSTLILLYPECK